MTPLTLNCVRHLVVAFAILILFTTGVPFLEARGCLEELEQAGTNVEAFPPQEQSKRLKVDLVISTKPLKASSRNASNFGIQSYGVTRKDFELIGNSISGKNILVPIRITDHSVMYGDRSLVCSVVGTSDTLIRIENISLREGRFLTTQDIEKKNNVAVISNAVAKQVFPEISPIGKNVRIKNDYFIVVGVTEADGPKLTIDHTGLPNVYIPVSTMRVRMGDTTVKRNSGSLSTEVFELSQIRIALHRKETLANTSELISRLLRANHKEKDYTVESFK